MTGFVHRIAAGGGYCFIRTSDSTDYFAHKRDFKDRMAMKVSQYVNFTPVPMEGKNDAATNVEPIAA